MSIDAVSTSYSIFSKDLYTIYVGTGDDKVAYDSSVEYSTDAIYTVSMNYTSGEIPLALLYAAMQIALSDIAAYKAESYMEKIETNQAIQTAASNAIAEAEALQDTLDETTTSVAVTADLVANCASAGISDVNGTALSTTADDGTVTYANLTSDQLTTLIEELDLAQENASSTTQTDMVYAEEYLGQYNSYLTGSSSTLDDLSNALTSIAGRIG